MIMALRPVRNRFCVDLCHQRVVNREQNIVPNISDDEFMSGCK